MAESEGIQEVVQATTVVMMALRGPDVGLHLAPVSNLSKPQWQRHGDLALEKPLFNWNVQDRYVELMNFEMKVMNILETKAYELTDKERVPVIKRLLGQESLQLMKTFMNEEKEEYKMAKYSFQSWVTNLNSATIA